LIRGGILQLEKGSATVRVAAVSVSLTERDLVLRSPISALVALSGA